MAALDFTFERREELIRRDSLEEGIEKGIEKGIIALVNTYKRFNATKAEAVVAVEKEFSLTQEKAESCVEKYWSE